MFVPRALTRKHSVPAPPPAAHAVVDVVQPAPAPPDTLHALLLSLALSDHALCADPALRDPNRDGFVALAALLRTSPVFAGASPRPAEVALVKALRAHAEHAFDIRMVMARSASEAGGYELRRSDWHSVLRQFPAFDRKYWHLRTIYIENIPASHRSLSDVARFLASALPPARLPRFQHIAFPAPPEDSPAHPPRCRGSALLVLSRPEDADALLLQWPWDSPPRPARAPAARLRALPRARWQQLQDEYAAYRADLLRTAAAVASADATLAAGPDDRSPHPDPDPSAAYPANCLVRARNVSPDTNKTALRALFSAALSSAALSSAALPQADAIDYVDYTKGLDTCFLRLATPRHARALVAHFAAAPAPLNTAQKHHLECELVQGRREELYWEQVPEHVRQQAVRRACEAGGAQDAALDEEPRARKRRRRQK